DLTRGHRARGPRGGAVYLVRQGPEFGCRFDWRDYRGRERDGMPVFTAPFGRLATNGDPERITTGPWHCAPTFWWVCRFEESTGRPASQAGRAELTLGK